MPDGYGVQLRKLMATHLGTLTFSLTAPKPTIDQVWVPYYELEDLPTINANGIIYLLSLVHQEEDSKTRNNSSLLEIPLVIGYIKPVGGYTTSICDPLDYFVQELRNACRSFSGVADNGYSYDLSRVEPLADPNGVPFHYTTMRETSTFEAHFTAYFKLLVPG